jgi:hypothetical protein
MTGSSCNSKSICASICLFVNLSYLQYKQVIVPSSISIGSILYYYCYLQKNKKLVFVYLFCFVFFLNVGVDASDKPNYFKARQIYLWSWNDRVGNPF